MLDIYSSYRYRPFRNGPLTRDDEEKELAGQALIERVADRSSGEVLDVENIGFACFLPHKLLELFLPVADVGVGWRQQVYVELVTLLVSENRVTTSRRWITN